MSCIVGRIAGVIGDGVIGNTAGSGSAIGGSSPPPRALVTLQLDSHKITFYIYRIGRVMYVCTYCS